MSADLDVASRTCRSALFYHVSFDMDDAVQRLRRPAGQLQLVRPERDALHARHHEQRLVPGAGRRRLRRDPRSARLAHRLQRVAGRQHPAPQQGHRRVAEHPADSGERVTGAGRRRAAFRFNWDTPMVFSPHDPGALLVARQQGVPVERSRRLVDGRSARDLTTNADRNEIVMMGVRGNRDPHRRATTASRTGRRSSRSPNRRSRPASTSPAPTTAS